MVEILAPVHPNRERERRQNRDYQTLKFSRRISFYSIYFCQFTFKLFHFSKIYYQLFNYIYLVTNYIMIFAFMTE